MSKKLIYSSVAFFTVLAFHIIFKLWQASTHAGQWLQEVSKVNLLRLYISQQDYFLGLSYAISAAFMVYSFFVFFDNRKAGTNGVLGSMTFIGFLYFAGCFLIGCCGSPMLPLYLGLFGSSFLGFIKPIVFGITLISIALGVWWMKKKICVPCCKPKDKCCG